MKYVISFVCMLALSTMLFSYERVFCDKCYKEINRCDQVEVTIEVGPHMQFYEHKIFCKKCFKWNSKKKFLFLSDETVANLRDLFFH